MNDCEVKVYLTERVIDGSKYAEQLCARSWEEAEKAASASGAKVIGTLQSQVCARCGIETDFASMVSKRLGDDEWPEEVGDRE